MILRYLRQVCLILLFFMEITTSNILDLSKTFLRNIISLCKSFRELMSKIEVIIVVFICGRVCMIGMVGSFDDGSLMFVILTHK